MHNWTYGSRTQRAKKLPKKCSRKTWFPVGIVRKPSRKRVELSAGQRSSAGDGHVRSRHALLPLWFSVGGNRGESSYLMSSSVKWSHSGDNVLTETISETETVVLGESPVLSAAGDLMFSWPRVTSTCAHDGGVSIVCSRSTQTMYL